MQKWKTSFNLFYKTVRTLAKPLAYYTGKISWRFSRGYNISSTEVQLALSEVQPGDIILTYKNYNFSNYTISGDYDHVAIVQDSIYTVEAVGTGVKKTELRKLLSHADEIKILRPKFCDSVTSKQAAQTASTLIGLPYDYDFKYSLTNNKALYCSEVIWFCYDKAMDGNCPFKPRMILGEWTILPSDFSLATKRWSRVLQIGNRN